LPALDSIQFAPPLAPALLCAAFNRTSSAFHRQKQQQQPNSSTKTSPRYVAWSGDECVPGTIQLSAGLAAVLQLPAGTEVQLEALPRLAAAAAVVVEPVAAADWEVVELNAGLLEDMLLSQVRWVTSNLLQTLVSGHCDGGRLGGGGAECWAAGGHAAEPGVLLLCHLL
jgi:hypothetical protein